MKLYANFRVMGEQCSWSAFAAKGSGMMARAWIVWLDVHNEVIRLSHPPTPRRRCGASEWCVNLVAQPGNASTDVAVLLNCSTARRQGAAEGGRPGGAPCD